MSSKIYPMSAIVKELSPLPEYPDILNSEKALFLTEKQVRAYLQFRDAPEEEIINIINTLHQLALITYEVVSAELNQQAGINQAA